MNPNKRLAPFWANWTRRRQTAILPLTLLSLIACPAAAQAPATKTVHAKSAPGQQAAATRPLLFIAVGPTTEDAIARLRAALGKVEGVEQIAVTARTGKLILRIIGPPMNSLLTASAKSVGFTLRPMPDSVFTAAQLSADADLQKLRDALGKVEGVEQVEASGDAANAEVRVLGDVKSRVLAEAAKTAGFDLRRSGYFVAAGSTNPDEVARLRATLTQVAGVVRLDVRQVAGGTMLGAQGAMEDADLIAAAKSAGYELRPMMNPANGPFLVSGIAHPGDKERLRKAIQPVPGIGYFLIKDTPHGTELTLPISVAKPQMVAEAAKTAGFTLRPVYPFFEALSGAEMERDTSAAPNDRILEDLTKVGDAAPDFTLITSHGQSKIGLSDYRGKRPVVLIFGSYT